MRIESPSRRRHRSGSGSRSRSNSRANESKAQKDQKGKKEEKSNFAPGSMEAMMAEMGLPVGFETTKVLYLCNNRQAKELVQKSLL